METNLLADRGETTSLAALVDGLGDPVDLGITANLVWEQAKIINQNRGQRLPYTAEKTHSFVRGID